MTGAALSLGGGNRAGLLLAALLAVLAGILVYVAVNAGDGDGGARSPAVPSTRMITVTQAKQDIPARTEITADMVETIELPRDGVLAGALASTDLVVGRTTRIPIYQGEQFVPEKLTSLSALTASSLTYIVPEGRRAMAITADKVSTAGGLLRPGDRVDVIVLLDLDYANPVTDGTVSEARAMTIAQNVEVLAVEQALQNRLTTEAEVAEGVPVDQPVPQPDASVVTVALTPQETQEFFLADDRGSIRLAVRGPGDDSVAELTDTTFISLTDPEFERFIREALGGLTTTNP